MVVVEYDILGFSKSSFRRTINKCLLKGYSTTERFIKNKFKEQSINNRHMVVFLLKKETPTKFVKLEKSLFFPNCNRYFFQFWLLCTIQ